MVVIELKRYIFENDKIEFVLENLGCHNIRYDDWNDYYSAAFPDGDNPMGINISNNEWLNYWSWSRNVSHSDRKDLISLVEYIKSCSFVNAVKYLHDILGLKYDPTARREKKKEKKFDPLAVFTDVLKSTRKKVSNMPTLDEEELDEYIPILHIDWFREGIMPWTREKFGLAYSYKRKRVVIPHRYWLTGKLIGMNMRTTVDNYEEFGISKYMLTKGYDKSNNLYGYWENHDEIDKLGYCVLYEGEKSVLKRDSILDSSGLALSGKFCSEEQRRIILSLNIKEIVVALDNDVDINEIRHVCEKFYRIRKVSYIYDKWGILGEGGGR